MQHIGGGHNPNFVYIDMHYIYIHIHGERYIYIHIYIYIYWSDGRLDSSAGTTRAEAARGPYGDPPGRPENPGVPPQT